jgi:hypothetical protein
MLLMFKRALTEKAFDMEDKQSRIQKLVTKLHLKKKEKKKAVAELNHELQLTKENHQRAESKAAEAESKAAEAAAAALRCQLEDVKQGEANKQVVVSFRSFIAAGSFPPSKFE